MVHLLKITMSGRLSLLKQKHVGSGGGEPALRFTDRLQSHESLRCLARLGECLERARWSAEKERRERGGHKRSVRSTWE